MNRLFSYDCDQPKNLAWPKSQICVFMYSFLEEVATKWTTYIKSDETCLERQIWSGVKTILMFETKTYQNLCVVQLILAKNPYSIMVTGGLVNGNQYERQKEFMTVFELVWPLEEKKVSNWSEMTPCFTRVQATSL